MKKALCLIFAFALLLSSCAKGIEVGEFSYGEVSTYYLQKIKDGEPGIRNGGFKNTEKSEIETAEDAVSLAKKEYVGEYKNAEVFYDSQSKVWRVSFSQGPDVLGGCVDVFIDSNGITLLMVAGE